MALVKVVIVSALVMAATSCVADLELGETDGGSETTIAGSEPSDTGESTASGANVTNSGAAATVGGDGDWVSEFSQRRCEALFACDCDQQAVFTNFTDFEDCVELLAERLADRESAAPLFGADQFSSSCYLSQLDLLTGDSCGALASPASVSEVVDAAFCRLFVGSNEEGEACLGPNVSSTGDSSCAEGLWCREAVCRRPPAEGEVCLLDQGVGPSCASPSTCIDGVCVPPRDLGEPCEQWQCDKQLRCAQGACVARGAVGASCERSGDCLSSLCIDDVCLPPLPALCGPTED